MTHKRLQLAIKALLQYYYDEAEEGTGVDWTVLDQLMDDLRVAYKEVI